MQTQTSPRPAPQRTDIRTQRAVLALVLHEYPILMTWTDLDEEIAPAVDLNRAVSELVAVGLLSCEGATVLPTAAALHFEWLEAA